MAQQADSLITHGITDTSAQLKLVKDGFRFTEGPAVDREGNIYFTDQPNNRIWKYDIKGELTIFMENAGRANGLFFDKKGNLIACADEHDELWRIQKNGKVEKLVNNYQDTLLNGPNDVWVAPTGVIYFTDPYYQRDYWKRTSPDLKVEALYSYQENGKVTRLDANFKRPNGIIGTPDGKYLYVADIDDNKTYQYTIQKDGSLTNKTLFVAQGSDGMTIDRAGNLYLTGNGITVYNTRGEKIAHIPVPNRTSNVCFGGKQRDLLFITARDKVFTLKMNVKGVK
ncbi:SMP-30/gluconolactonase/LRE family protein [Olivibacter ginsenosidimutans]|uniref:SMP-30/gluconolactonase/LRE family protein n=2 Tax=Olivibacter ginsenosidimutans TaxID=1176537 RepID=A0ABP9BIA4_9SPHI